MACSSDLDYSLVNSNEDTNIAVDTINLNYLALGDSYTIGTSVCDTCNYPTQLIDSLALLTDPIYNSNLEIIATSGWTTTDLLAAINSTTLSNDYDLVTLLIGVNNQFQGKSFSIYESEFNSLLSKAISVAGGRRSNVIVLSIPDYAFTTFGQNWGNPVTTSSQIDTYNAYAEAICTANDVSFLNITDISREGLSRTELVASDGLHLSSLAYSEMVSRLLPIVRSKLERD